METQFSYSLGELINNASLFHSSVCESSLSMKRYIKSSVYKPKAAKIVYDYTNNLYEISVKVYDWCMAARENNRQFIGEEEIQHLQFLFHDLGENSNKTDYLLYQLPDAPAIAQKNFQERKVFLEEMITSLDEIISTQNND